MLDIERLPAGSVLGTTHGNRLRRFKDGWSPQSGAHWDRWSVYTSQEVVRNFSGLKLL